MTVHTYIISTETANGIVSAKRLTLELDVMIPGLLKSIGMQNDTLTITTFAVLDATQKATLDAVVVAHTGATVPTVKFHASTKLVQDSTAITQDISWQVLGGVVSKPSFFTSNIPYSFSRISGMLQHSGLTVELRLVQTEADGTQTILTPAYICDDEMGGMWMSFEIITNVPPHATDECTYELEGRLNGSASASVKFCSMTLLELIY